MVRCASGCGWVLGELGWSPRAAPQADRHDGYVFSDRGYYVYGVERHFALIQSVRISGLTELRDAVADAKGGCFYISYGTNHIRKWDFVHERQVWDRTYEPGYVR
jgi:hypothetical protein